MANELPGIPQCTVNDEAILHNASREMCGNEIFHGMVSEMRVAAALYSLPEVGEIIFTQSHGLEDSAGIDLQVTMADLNGVGEEEIVYVQVKSQTQNLQRWRKKVREHQMMEQDHPSICPRHEIILLNGGIHTNSNKNKRPVTPQDITKKFRSQYVARDFKQNAEL